MTDTMYDPKELATRLIDFAKESDACGSQYLPALFAFNVGDYEDVIATARGNVEWLAEMGWDYEDWMGNGILKHWHTVGQLHETITLVDNKAHGLYQEWYYEWSLWCQVGYVNNERHGSYKEWNEYGKLICNQTYDNGQLVY